MATFPEIKSSHYKRIDGTLYFVRKFGLDKKVLEEELLPVSEEKTIRVLKADGSEDAEKTAIVVALEAEKKAQKAGV